MMRVAHINSVCGIRSTGRIMSQLALGVEAAGGTSLMIYGRETVPESLKSKAYRMESPLGVRLHGVQARLFDAAGLSSAVATRRLLAKLDAFSPDIVHLHNLHGYYIHYSILFDYIKKKRIPVVMTLHDCWTFTGHCSNYTYVGCDRWQKGCHHCPQRKEYPASWLLDRSQKNYRLKQKVFQGVEEMMLVTPSRWLAGECKKSFLGEYPVCVIPNGIDLSQFVPTPSDIKKQFGLENKRVLLAVSTAWGDGRKGLDDIIRLPELLPKDCKVVVVGVTQKEAAKLPPSIVAIERTNNVRELAQWYSAADVFINPTCEDNYPTVNLEAIACGTPVVTYPVGGSPEAVIPGVTGYVTEKADVWELARMSLKAMELKHEGLDDYGSGFGLDCFVEKYISLYQQLCQKKG